MLVLNKKKPTAERPTKDQKKRKKRAQRRAHKANKSNGKVHSNTAIGAILKYAAQLARLTAIQMLGASSGQKTRRNRGMRATASRNVPKKMKAAVRRPWYKRRSGQVAAASVAGLALALVAIFSGSGYADRKTFDSAQKQPGQMATAPKIAPMLKASPVAGKTTVPPGTFVAAKPAQVAVKPITGDLDKAEVASKGGNIALAKAKEALTKRQHAQKRAKSTVAVTAQKKAPVQNVTLAYASSLPKGLPLSTGKAKGLSEVLSGMQDSGLKKMVSDIAAASDSAERDRLLVQYSRAAASKLNKAGYVEGAEAMSFAGLELASKAGLMGTPDAVQSYLDHTKYVLEQDKDYATANNNAQEIIESLNSEAGKAFKQKTRNRFRRMAKRLMKKSGEKMPHQKVATINGRMYTHTYNFG